MKVRMEGADPCLYLVSSQSDMGKEYLVDICANPLGLDEEGNMRFNGACIQTRTPDEWREYGCESFRYTCQPKLDKPENMGKVFRCLHCRAAMDYAFKLLLPYIAKNRPVHEEPL